MKKVFVLSVQPDPDGPVFGRVMDPNDFQKSQDYSHEHVTQIVKDLLVAGAASAQVTGFLATLSGGLNVSVALGNAVDNQGVSYESQSTATVLGLAAADPALPRIDLIYAALEIDTAALSEFRPFRRLRTQAELEAGTPEFPPTQFNQATELHTRATLAVRAGTPNASPVAPATGANEVPLWRVHVAAGQVTLLNPDLTDVRVLMKSLYQVLTDVVTLQNQVGNLSETIDDRVAALLLNLSGITKSYNDAGNLLSIGLDLEVVDDRVATLLQNGLGITLTYDDAGNHLVISSVLATNVTDGLMPSADKAKLDAATSANTANAIVRRDANGDITIRDLASRNSAAIGHSRLGVPDPSSPPNALVLTVTAGDVTSGPLNTSSPTAIVSKNNANGTDPRTLQVGGNCNVADNTAHGGVLDVYTSNVGSPGSGVAFHGNLLKLRGTTGTAEKLALKCNTFGDLFVGNNLTVAGSISKGSGTFLIDHPLDPNNKDLIHGFIEAPRFDLIYRGSVQLVDGEAAVNIDLASGMSDGTFAALADNAQIWLQNRSGWDRVRVKAGTLLCGLFTIEAENPESSDWVEWLVIGERKDDFVKLTPGTDEDGRLNVEVEKPVGDASLLNPVTEVRRMPAAAPDFQLTQVVQELVGTQGYPRYAFLTNPESVPKRVVTIHTTDMDGNPYEEP